MWLSEQQKRPAPSPRGQTGVVVMTGESLAVRVEGELRDPDVCAPAGYRWTPAPGDRVLVLQSGGECPCVVGVRRGGTPKSVELHAEDLHLNGRISVNGVALETYIRQVMEGSA